MYHILAPQGHGQDGAFLGKKKTLSAVVVNGFVRTSDPPGLVEPLSPVLARIRGVDQKPDLALPCRGLDALGTVDEIARSRLHSEAIESGLTESALDALAEVGRNVEVSRPERPSKGTPQPVAGIGLVELGPPNADPGAAAGGPGGDVRCDGSVGPEREPDQVLPRRGPPREDAGALGNVRV